MGAQVVNILKSDLVIMRRKLVHHAVLWTIALLATSLILSNSPLLVLFVGLPEAMMFVQELSALEGKHRWEGMRLALPFSRTEMLVGRYLSVALAAVFMVALAAVVHLLAAAIIAVVPTIGQITGFSVGLNLPMLVLCCAASIAFALFAMGIVLPLVARGGFAGITPFVACGVMLAASLAIMSLGPSALGLISKSGLLFDASFGQIALLSVALLAAATLWYAVSAAIATRLYAKREF